MGKYQDIHIEKDFWDDFIVEAFEHIEDIETNAMSLEQNPEDTDIIHTMFRAFHTIKGLSGFVEHTAIQEIAHKTETMMDFCRKGELQVSTQIVDAILKSSDYIKQLCENMEAFKDENLVNQIEELLTVLEELSNVTPSDAPSAEVFQPVQEEHNPESEVASVVASEEDLQAFASDFSFVKEDDSECAPKEEVYEEVQEPVSETQEAEIPAEVHNEEAFEQPQEAVAEVENELAEDEPVFEEQQQEQEPQVESVSENEGSFVENLFTACENVEVAQEVKVEQVEEVQALKDEVVASATIEPKKEEPKEPTPEELALKDFQKTLLAKLGGGVSGQSKQAESSGESQAAKTVSSNEEYMKVANYKINNLVDMMGELIINQALIEQYVQQNYTDDRQLVTNMSGFLRITRELQNLSMSLRMVSFKPTFQKIARIARDTIQELKKDVEFVISGENTEIDRIVTDKLLDPLVHLIKNAISHGVEADVEDRIKLGKPRRARVELNAYSKRGKIFIEVKDDGRGINTEVVYNKAVEKGLVDPNKTYTDAEIREFIMLPGFSTAAVVDNISGRGVGMDVVKTQILKTGGKVDIQSTLHQGSTFTLEVPVNHAIMNGTIIEMNNQHFVVPTVNVKEFLQPTKEQWIFTKQERTMIRVRDNIIPIVPLSTFFKDVKEPENVPLVMVLELDQELRAVPIVNVVNRQEVVVKPVESEFSHLKFISGMSILGTGKVSLILDIDYLFRKETNE